MRQIVIILGVLVVAVAASPANAHLIAKPKCGTLHCRETSQHANLKHARFLCHYGRNATRRWGCSAVRWLKKEYGETEAVLHPRVAPVSVDSCLSTLISRESGWNVKATNPSSGAYGLPQALPGSKMASAGSDWATNPATQIRWMKEYVRHYGGSCAALDFQIRNGWY